MLKIEQQLSIKSEPKRHTKRLNKKTMLPKKLRDRDILLTLESCTKIDRNNLVITIDGSKQLKDKSV